MPPDRPDNLESQVGPSVREILEAFVVEDVNRRPHDVPVDGPNLDTVVIPTPGPRDGDVLAEYVFRYPNANNLQDNLLDEKGGTVGGNRTNVVRLWTMKQREHDLACLDGSGSAIAAEKKE